MLLVSVVLTVVVIILIGHINHLNKKGPTSPVSPHYIPMQGYRYSENLTDDVMKLIKCHPYASGATQYLMLSYDQVWQLQKELRLAELNSIILYGLAVSTEEEIDD